MSVVDVLFSLIGSDLRILIELKVFVFVISKVLLNISKINKNKNDCRGCECCD